MAEIVETPGTGFQPVARRLMSRRYVAAQNGRFANRPFCLARGPTLRLRPVHSGRGCVKV